MQNPAPDYRDFHQTPGPAAALEIDYTDGFRTGWHDHPRAQLLFAIQGVMQVRTAIGSWIVPPNRAVWVAPNVGHEVRMCGAVKMRTVFVDVDAHGRLPADNQVIAVSPLLRELIMAAVAVPLDYDPAGRDGRLIHLLLDELRVADVLPLHLPASNHPYVMRIAEDLRLTPGGDHSAEAWARRLGVAAKTLHRLFRGETGMTFGEWRRQGRLLAALERLARGEKVIDVAAECGYASQSAFTAMFRRRLGVPPSSYYRN